MPDALKLRLHLVGADNMPVRQMTKIELHARLKSPFKRYLIYRGRGFAAIHGRGIVPRRIQVGSIVRRERDRFHGPRFAIGKVGRGEAGKERGHLIHCGLVIAVINRNLHARWIGDHIGAKRNGQINDARHENDVVGFGRQRQDFAIESAERGPLQNLIPLGRIARLKS